MRAIVFNLVFICLPFISQAYDLDTIKGSIVISNNDIPYFEIPIHSINVEESKAQVSSQLGSVHFKEKQKNKYHPSVTNKTSREITISDGDAEAIFILSNGDLTISTSSGFIHFSMVNLDNELFYGGGMQFSHTLLNGEQIVNICEENGVGRGDKPISRWTKLIGVEGAPYASYYPLPFVVSNKNRGFSVDDKALSVIRIGSVQTDITIYNKLSCIHLFTDVNMLGVIQQFNQLNGRGFPFPEWAMGNIIGIQGGTKQIKERLSPLFDRKIPIDAIWIQDWVGKRKTRIGSRLNWAWQLDSSYNGIFEYASNHNLKVLGYINPFFAETGKYTTEGLSNKYFVLEENKVKEFDFGGMKGYMLDLFNPVARSWMKQIIVDNLVQNGFDGWMADFAEWYPLEETDGVSDHNSYVHEWVKLNNEIIQESDKGLFVFHRSGNIGSAHYSQATWCGDQMTSYGSNDGLPSAINAMISGGLSGLPPTHSDIGGYTSIKKPIIKSNLRSTQLLKDWIKLEAFTPFFRSHEGLLPENDIQIYSNTDIIEYYGRYAHIHAKLSSYFLELSDDYHKTGTPIIRHPILVGGKDVPYSFYVGEDIYIQFSTASPEIPNGFELFPSKEGSSNVYIATRIGSQVSELIRDL